MSFETELRKALNDAPSEDKQDARRIKRILDMPASPRKKRILARMERHVAVQLDMKGDAKIDWKTIDWSAMLSTIIKVLAALLPFLL